VFFLGLYIWFVNTLPSGVTSEVTSEIKLVSLSRINVCVCVCLCSIWDWEQGSRLSAFSVRNPRHTRITYSEFINAHDHALLLTGSGMYLLSCYHTRSLVWCLIVTGRSAVFQLLASEECSGCIIFCQTCYFRP